ncbi:hypothetical protein V502_09003 [Pseudogymnoascus sp. VKM F-4520 (FW-2644)]|nr:hypothetical protein V502_09003 [Pseudogymnoascus sp. VKM F-4520 (FW-2644)]
MFSSTSKMSARPGTVKGFYSLFYEWSVANSSARTHSLCTGFSQATASSQLVVQARGFTCSSRRQHVKSARPDDEPPLSTHLRQLMRKMPHAAVVATTSTGGPASSSTSNFRGMTVSSFTTVTLTPTPIVSFNIRRPSRTLDAIRQSRQFLIHILSATESGANVAHGFTKGNSTDVFANQQFAVWNVGSKYPLPLLSSPGVTKVLRCKLRDEGEGAGLIEVGDHMLVLADVESIIEPPPTKDAAALEDRGLSYLDRAYREVGKVIDVIDTEENEELEKQ